MNTPLLHDAANACRDMPNPQAWVWLVTFFRSHGLNERQVNQHREAAWKLRRVLLTGKPPAPTTAPSEPARAAPAGCEVDEAAATGQDASGLTEADLAADLKAELLPVAATPDLVESDAETAMSERPGRASSPAPSTPGFFPLQGDSRRWGLEPVWVGATGRGFFG